MLWIKAFHIVAMVTWFGGLFYLPRLFVYHAMSTDQISQERFKIMERKLYYGIMTPGAVFTILLGLWLLHAYAWQLYKSALWLHLKLALVLILILYHLYCGYLRRQFELNQNTHSHVFYRWLNEFPVLLLIGIVILAVVKPF
ncbi:MAG TPA: protoporphyrinogen oxidase HemJ [Gammaproteobacteria bacterium]|nr:protoporphyrinogen oxidase HemJ [Gammaproteobacteria bacterium]